MMPRHFTEEILSIFGPFAHSMISCFNDASAFHRGNHLLGPHQLRDGRPASMMPRHFTEEIPTPPTLAATVSVCFNDASAFHRGNHPLYASAHGGGCRLQ